MLAWNHPLPRTGSSLIKEGQDTRAVRLGSPAGAGLAAERAQAVVSGPCVTLAAPWHDAPKQCNSSPSSLAPGSRCSLALFQSYSPVPWASSPFRTLTSALSGWTKDRQTDSLWERAHTRARPCSSPALALGWVSWPMMACQPRAHSPRGGGVPEGLHGAEAGLVLTGRWRWRSSGTWPWETGHSRCRSGRGRTPAAGCEGRSHAGPARSRGWLGGPAGSSPTKGHFQCQSCREREGGKTQKREGSEPRPAMGPHRLAQHGLLWDAPG